MTRRFVPSIPALLLCAACGGGDGGSTSPGAPTSPGSPSVGLDVPFGIEDLRVGTGREAMNGDALSVTYTGWLYDPAAPDAKGARFDSGAIPSAGFPEYVLGAGQVIAGWDRGLIGMRVGGLRRLVIPPALGYGASGRPPTIPGNATLLFEVELLGIE